MSHPGNQQWPPPGPSGPRPSGRSKAPWVVGGVAGVLVVLLGVGWTLYSVGVFDVDTSGGSTSKPSGEDETAEEAAVYKMDKSLQETCDGFDLTMYSDLMPELDIDRIASEGASLDGNSLSCTAIFQEDTKADGSCTQCINVSIEVTVFGENDSQGSAGWFEFEDEYLRQDEVMADARITEFDGDWNEGLIGCTDRTDSSGKTIEASGLCYSAIWHGNLGVKVKNDGIAPDDPDYVTTERLTELQEETIASVKESLAV